MTYQKPLLLLDVDGPLNPYGARSCPNGYQMHRIKPDGWSNELRVWLNPRHGRMLQEITRYVELVWATAWRDEANTFIGPRIGLPQLPVIQFERPTHAAKHIWKLTAVEQYVGHRAFAWFDDDFTRADLDWAAVRSIEIAPTLLHSIDPAIGIVRADVDSVERWAHTQLALASNRNPGWD
jgi:hypothetical protein